MKHLFRKTLAMLLAIVMVVGVLPLGIFSFPAGSEEPVPPAAPEDNPDVPAVENPEFEFPSVVYNQAKSDIMGSPVYDVTIDGYTYKKGDSVKFDINENFEYDIVSYGESTSTLMNALVVKRKPDAPDSSATLVISSGTRFINELGEDVKYTRVYFGDGVIGIENCTADKGPFKEQTILTDVYASNDLKSIGNYAFYKAQLLEHAYLAAVSKVGSYAFNGTKLTPLEISGNDLYDGQHLYIGTSATCRDSFGDPAAKNGEVKVGAYAFQSGPSVKYLQIGNKDTVKVTTETHSFSNMGSLEQAVFGNNAYVTVGPYTFYNDGKLDIVRLGEAGIIQNDAFRYDYTLGKTLGYLDLRGITDIGTSAFRSCYTTNSSYPSLRRVILGDTLTSIGSHAFYNNQKLSDVNLEEATALTTIGSYAFTACNLASVTIPASVKTIAAAAFARNVNIHDGYEAVTGPKVLATLTFAPGSQLETIGDSAFYNQKLTEVTIPVSVKSIAGWAFGYQTAMTKVIFNTVGDISIGGYAFYQSGIKELYLTGANVNATGNYVFAGNYISNLTLNATLSLNLGTYAFYNNRDLTAVTFNAPKITLGDYCFYNSYKSTYPRPATDPDARYHTLRQADFIGSEVKIGSYAFCNQINLANVNLMYVKDANKLTLGTYAFGHDRNDAYYETQDYDVYDAQGQPDTVQATTGLKLGLAETDPNGPLHNVFSNNRNYYGGENVSIVLKSAKYPTCTEEGMFLYEFILNQGETDERRAEIRNTVNPLGHMYVGGANVGPNCVYGNHSEQICVRGCVDDEIGTDPEGYAYGWAGEFNYYAGEVEHTYTEDEVDELYFVNQVQVIKIENIWYRADNPSEQYAGTVIKKYFAKEDTLRLNELKKVPVAKTGVDASGFAIYEGVTVEDCPGLNFTQMDDGSKPLGHYFAVGETVIRSGSVDVVEKLEPIADMTAIWSSATGNFTFIGDIVYANGSKIEYGSYGGASGFIGYKPLRVTFVCARDNHMNADNTTTTLESKTTELFIPTTLTAKADQTLSEVKLGVTNLRWKDETQILAGPGGTQYYTAIYTPETFTISGYYEEVEVLIPIYVSHVDLSLESITFTNTRQTVSSNTSDYMPVGVRNLPDALTKGAATYAGLGGTYLSETALPTEQMDGTVEVAFTYYSDIYDLVEEGGSVLVADGYTFRLGETQNVDGRMVTTVYLQKDFYLQPASLDIITVTGDNTVYDGEGHGFVIDSLPAGVKVTVKQVDASGIEISGGFTKTWTESDPASGLTVLNDLRTVTVSDAMISDAGTYYFEVTFQPETVAAKGSYGSDPLTLDVTTVIRKATVPAPTGGTILSYTGKTQTGFVIGEDAAYHATEGSTLSAKNAGTYTVTLALNSDNYIWADGGTTDKQISWIIRKNVAQLPAVRADALSLTYNGQVQTPLDWSVLNLADDPANPEIGEYKLETVTASGTYTAGTVLVYICLWNEAGTDTEWKLLYAISGSNHTDHNADPYTIDVVGDIFDSNNFQWPNDTAPVFQAWNIQIASIEKPVLNLDGVSYTGSPVETNPVLTGSWDTSAFAFDKIAFNQFGDLAKHITYYTVFSDQTRTQTTAADGATTPGSRPANVGQYYAVIELGDYIDSNNVSLIGGNTVVTGFYVNKQSIVLTGTEATVDYNGEFQFVPDPVMNYRTEIQKYIYAPDELTTVDLTPEEYEMLEPDEKAKCTPVLLVLSDALPEGVIFSYYKPKYESGQLAVDEAGSYIPDGDAVILGGGTIVGTYTFLVKISDYCTSYESPNYAVCTVTIVSADQRGVVESEDVPVSSETNSDGIAVLTATPTLGDAKFMIRLRGTDENSDIAVYNEQGALNKTGTVSYLGGKITLKLMTVANPDNENDKSLYAEVSVKAVCSTAIRFTVGSTTNANATTAILVIDVQKATPTVTVNVSDKTYDGNPAAVSATVEGVKIDGGTGAYVTPTGTDGQHLVTDATKISYTYYADNDGLKGAVIARPSNVGKYWVEATYAGDDSYAATTGEAVRFEISNANLNVTLSSAVNRNYNGVGEQAITVVSVKGVNDTPIAAGNYQVYYFGKSNVEPREDDAGWSTSPVTVLNVADSGRYWVKIVSDNYSVKVKYLDVSILPVRIAVNAGEISVTKPYDGTKTAFSRDGNTGWTAGLTCGNAADLAVVNAELVFGVTAEYNATPVGKNYLIRVSYAVSFVPGSNGSTENLGNYLVKYADDADYAVPTASHADSTTYGSAGVITKRPVTVSGITGIDREYDGTVSVNLTAAPVANNVVAGESITYVMKNNVTAVLSSANAGTYTVSGFKLGNTVVTDLDTLFTATAGENTDLDNYYVSEIAVPAVTVAKRTVAIDSSSVAKEYVYTGEQITGYKTGAAVPVGVTYNPDAAAMAAGLQNVAAALTYSFYEDQACTTPVTGSPVTVGTYYLVVAYSNTEGNFSNAQSAPLAVNVVPAPLTVQVDSAKTSWVYDGQAHSLEEMIASVTGTAHDGVFTSGDYTLSFYKEGTPAAAVTEVTHVAENGNYIYTITKDNYAVASAAIAVTVLPKPVTLTYTGLQTEKVYDGNATAVVNSAVTVSGAIAAETVSATATAAFNEKTVAGASNVTVRYAMQFGGGADYRDYCYTVGNVSKALFANEGGNITASNTVLGARITRRPVDVTAGVLAESRVYDGTAEVSVNGISLTLSGIIGGDTVTAEIVSGGIGTVSSNGVGTYTVFVPSSAVVLSGADANNYYAQNVMQPSVEITKATPSFTLPAYSKVGYSGTAVLPAYYHVSVIGNDGSVLAADSDASITYTFWLNEACTQPAVDDNASTVPVDHRDGDAPYYVKAVYAGDANHTAATKVFTLTIGETSFDMINSPVTPYTGVYDGQNHNVINSASVMSTLLTSGDHGNITGATAIYVIPVQTGETEAPALDAAGWVKVFENGHAVDSAVNVKNAGSYSFWYKLVSVSHETAAGAEPITVVITPKKLTVRENIYAERIYDGTVDAKRAESVPDVELVGVIDGENVTAILSSAVYDGKNVETDASKKKTITMTVKLLFADGALASNYEVEGHEVTNITSETPLNPVESAAIAHTVLPAVGENVYCVSIRGSITPRPLIVYGFRGVDHTYSGHTGAKMVVSGAMKTALWEADTTLGFHNETGILTTDQVSLFFLENAGLDVLRTVSAEPSTGAYGILISPEYLAANPVLMTGLDANNYRIATLAGETPTENILVTISPRETVISFSSAIVKTSATGADKAHAVELKDVNYSNVEGLKPASYDATVALKAILADDLTEKLNAELAAVKFTYTFYKADGTTAVTENGGIPQSAGTYYVKVTLDCSDLERFSNLDRFAADALWGKITILPGTLSVAHANISHVYNAQADDITVFTQVTGVNLENLIAKYSVKICKAAAGAGDVKTWFAANSSAVAVTSVKNVADSGTYYYKLSVPNYDDYYGSFTVNITKKAVTIASSGIVTGTAGSMNYTGKTQVPLSGTALTPVAAEGFYAADLGNITLTFVGSTGIAASKNVGTGIAVSVSKSDVQMTGTASGNYEITAVENCAVTILQILPTLTKPESSSAVFTNQPVLDTYYKVSVSGINGETGSANLPGSVKYTFTDAHGVSSTAIPKAVGKYTVSAVYRSGANDNYKSGAEITYEMEITAAGLTVTPAGYTGKYDGAAHTPATFTVIGADGQPITDYTVKFYKDEAYTQEITSVKNYSDSATYYFVISTANYADYAGSFSVSVSRIDVNLSSDLTTIKVYDGTDAAAVSDVSFFAVGSDAMADLLGSEFEVAAAAKYSTRNVGTGYVITVTYTLTAKSGALLENYLFNSSTLESTVEVNGSNAGIITKRAITVQPVPQTYVYDGTEPWTDCRISSSALWTVSSGAIQAGDTQESLNVTLIKSSGVHFGTYPITGTYENGNYNVTFAPADFTIGHRFISIVVGNGSGYYGDTPSLENVDLIARDFYTEIPDPIAQSEIARIKDYMIHGNIALRVDATASSAVGVYPIIASNGVCDLDFVVGAVWQGQYQINPRPITVVAEDLSKYYGTENAELQYHVEGTLCNGDTLSAVLSSAVAKNMPVGSTSIFAETVSIMNGGADKKSNYAVTTVEGVYTVLPASFQPYFAEGAGTKATTYGTDYVNPIHFTNIASGEEMTEENGNAYDGTITWSVDSTAIATVSSTGVVTPLTTGVVHVTAALSGSVNYENVTKTLSYDLAIAGAGSIIASATPYNGTQKLLIPGVDGQYADITLVTTEVTVPADAPLNYLYQVNGGDWTDTVPVASEAGTYVIVVEISDPAGMYQTMRLTVTSTVSALPQHNVRFRAMGGELTGSAAIRITEGVYLTSSAFPTVSYVGHEFLGWRNEVIDEALVLSAEEWEARHVLLTEATTFDAVWALGEMTVAPIADQTYTGEALTPALVLSSGMTALVPSADYAVYYENNVETGTAEAHIVGLGIYEGYYETVTFAIVAKTMDSTAILPVAEQVYTGTALKPALLIHDGAKVLTEGADYTVTYTNNTAVGTATANVTYTGNYTGTASVNFAIVAKANGISAELTLSGAVYNGGAQKPGITVKDGEAPLTEGIDYVVVYRDAEGNVVDAPADAGVYTVEVVGQGNYSGTLATKAFVIEALTVTASFADATVGKTYGDADFTNTLNIVPVNSHGTVSYISSNPNVVTVDENGKVTVIGAGTAVITANIAATANTTAAAASFTVTVAGKSSDGLTVEIASTAVYNGEGLTPAVTVKDGETVLKEGVDYIVTYTNNTEVGTATATVTFLGDYTGSAEKNFEIVANGESFVIGAMEDVVYNGKAHEPKPVITYAGVTLTEGTDYTLSYVGNVHAGLATVTVTGKGAYAAVSGQANFTVLPADIASAAIAPIADQTYTGNPIEPEAIVTFGELTLAEGTDFTVRHAGNISVGPATVSVFGKGDYTGSTFIIYTIVTKELTSDAIAAIADQTYTGDAIEPALIVKDGEKVLTEGKDYTVTYTNNTEVGTATAKITFVGNYKGSAEQTFEIVAKANEVNAELTLSGAVYNGGAQKPGITVKDGEAPLTEGIDYVVVYRDAEGNVVDAPAAAGVYTVEVVGQGNYSGTLATKAFVIEALTVTASFADATVGKTYGDADFTNTLNIVPVNSHGTVSYISSNPNVVTVDENGKVTVIGAGTAVITANIAATANTTAATASFTVTVAGKSSEGLTVEIASTAVYTGSGITPAVIVKDGETVLVEGVDYTVTYTNNTEIGTATAKVTFIGDYTGSAEETFEIVANGAAFGIGNMANEVYNGKAHEPKPVVTYAGVTLTEGTDYTLSYTGNVHAGLATVTVTGMGAYEAVSGQSNFVILPADIASAAIAAIADQTYTGAALEPAAAVTFGELILAEGTDFTVRYTSNVNMGTATVTVSGKGDYTGSTSATFRIVSKALSSDAIAAIPEQTYTGSAVEPKPIVKDGGKVLTEGVDYILTYTNNVNVGTATVKVEYIGNYTGSEEIPFTIAPLGSDIRVTAGKTSFVYNGKNQVPALTVKDGGKTLVNGVDYTLRYTTPDGKAAATVNAGVYVVTVVGKGNYTDTLGTVAFVIVPAPITAAFAEAKVEKTFGSEAFTNALTLTPVSGGTVRYFSDNTAVATVDAAGKVTVTGAGKAVITAIVDATANYEGASVAFEITVAAKSVKDFRLEAVEDQIFTGRALTPAVTVKDGDTVLVNGRDYTVSYSDNVAVGTAKVTVTGCGSYAGTLETSFRILANTATFEIGEIAPVVFDGTEVTPVPEVKYAGITLVKGTDYELEYSGNNAAGTGIVKVVGKGPYEGLTGMAAYTIKSGNVTSINPADASFAYLATVTAKNGFGGDVILVIERVDDDKMGTKFENGKKRLLTLDMALMCGGKEITELDDEYSVRLIVPAELADAKEIQVAYVKADGTVEYFETKVENGYILFETDHFGDFVFLGKTTWFSWWWILVLCGVLCITTIVICIVIVKKNKKDDEEENGDSDPENAETPAKTE